MAIWLKNYRIAHSRWVQGSSHHQQHSCCWHTIFRWSWEEVARYFYMNHSHLKGEEEKKQNLINRAFLPPRLCWTLQRQHGNDRFAVSADGCQLCIHNASIYRRHRQVVTGWGKTSYRWYVLNSRSLAFVICSSGVFVYFPITVVIVVSYLYENMTLHGVLCGSHCFSINKLLDFSSRHGYFMMSSQ